MSTLNEKECNNDETEFTKLEQITVNLSSVNTQIVQIKSLQDADISSRSRSKHRPSSEVHRTEGDNYAYEVNEETINGPF